MEDEFFALFETGVTESRLHFFYYSDGHFEGDGTTHPRDRRVHGGSPPRNNRPIRWQSRFHDHIIRDDESFDRIRQYIANNIFNWKEDKFYEEK